MDHTVQQSEVIDTLREIHHTQSQLLAAVESLTDRVSGSTLSETPTEHAPPTSSDSVIRSNLGEDGTLQAPAAPSPSQKSTSTSRIILTFVDSPPASPPGNMC